MPSPTNIKRDFEILFAIGFTVVSVFLALEFFDVLRPDRGVAGTDTLDIRSTGSSKHDRSRNTGRGLSNITRTDTATTTADTSSDAPVEAPTLGWHEIESSHIDTGSVTSRTIEDGTIRGKDIDRDTNIEVEVITAQYGSFETISAGSWNASVIGVAYGGTNATTIGSAGSIAYSTGTAYAFSAVGSAGQVFVSGGSGSPTWSTLGAASISADSLDFTELEDQLDLDASTDILADGSEVLSITNTGTGNSFVVNDQAGDTTPFVIDASGNVGIGDTTPAALFTVGSGDLFQVNSSGAIASATGITSSGTITFSGLSTAGIVTNTAGGVLGTTSTIGVTLGGTGTSTQFTQGSVVFAGASGVYSQDNANFFWDDTNNRLGIAYATPAARLDITGNTTTATEGSEQITATADRYFSSDTGNWTGTNWTVGGWLATHTAGANAITLAAAGLDPDPVAGGVYQISFGVSTTTVGTIAPSIGGGNGVALGQFTGYSTHTQIIAATDTSPLTFTPNATWVGSISNVSVKRIIPSNATQIVRNSDNTIGLEIRAGGTGLSNTLVGVNAGRAITTGSSNVFLGGNAGLSVTTGSSNSFIGYQSGYTNTTGLSNSFIGYQSGYANISGSYNNFIGYQSGYANISGSYNNFIGYQSGYANISSSYNNFIGYQSGYTNTTGSSNSFLGWRAGYSNTSGSFNTFLGNASGFWNTTGSRNIYLGNGAGGDSTTGEFNTFVGTSAGQNNTTGSYNTALGYQAGSTSAPGGNYNVTLGYGTRTGSTVASSIVLGYGAISLASNQLVIGSSSASITDAYFGQGVTSVSPAGIVLNATGGIGTNNAGGPLTLAGGKGTGSASGGSIIFATSDAGASGSTLQSLTTKATLLASGNFGIGDTTPASLLTVGSGDLFQINSSGAIAAATGITSSGAITFSGLTAGGVVQAASGTGLLSVSTLGASGITADSLDFTEFQDQLDLDASTDILVDGSEVFSITNTGTGNSFVVNDETSDATPFVINASGNVGIGGAASSSYPVLLTNSTSFGNFGFTQSSSTGAVKLATYVDSTAGWLGTVTAHPLYLYTNNSAARAILTVAGNFGVGDTTPAALLTVGDGDLFQINSSGAIAAATGITSSGSITFSGLTAGGVVQAASGTGLLSVSTLGASSITADSLDFTEFQDQLDLDASTDILVDGSEVLSITNTGTGNSFTVNDAAGDSTPFIINSSGRVGIGTTPFVGKLSIADSATSTVTYGMLVDVSDYDTALAASNLYGNYITVYNADNTGTGTENVTGSWIYTSSLSGSSAQTGTNTGLAIDADSGDTVYGINITSTQSDTTGVWRGIRVSAPLDVTTSATGVRIENQGFGGDTSYGLWLAGQGVGSGTASWAIYSAGTLDQSYIGGALGIGDTTPTTGSKLTILKSSTSASADTIYGSDTTVSDTGVVTSGTDTTYGTYTSLTRTGATGGTINSYGNYVTATATTAVGSLYGNHVTVTGGFLSYGQFLTTTGTGSFFTAGINNIVTASSSNLIVFGINSNVTSAASSTSSGIASSIADTSTTANTTYGLNSSVTDATAVTTGTDTIYGAYSSVTRTGATGGTLNNYGGYATLSGTFASGTGTINNYGHYATVTGNTTGTSTNYGSYVTVTGADTNYGFYGLITPTGGTTSYGTAVSMTDATTTANTLYGGSVVITDTGVVTTATDTIKGSYININRSGATGGGINVTGQEVNIQATAAGAATATTIGSSIFAWGGDTVTGQSILSYGVSGTTTVYGANITATGFTGDAGVTTYGVNVTATDSFGAAGTIYGVRSTVTSSAGGTATALYADAGTGAGTEYAGIFLNGNVGIGDTTPDQLLEILSSAAANTQFSIGNTNVGNYDAQIGFELADGTNTFTIGVDDSASDAFKISTTALGTNDRFVIDSTGSVGIGSYPFSGSIFDISGRALSAEPSGTGGIGWFTYSVTKNDADVKTFPGIRIAPTINTGASNANTTLNILAIDTSNTSTIGVTTNLIKASYGNVQQFLVASNGDVTAIGQVSGGDGLVTKVNAGACDDTTFTLDTNGNLCIDSTNGRIYYRYGGAWHYSAQTAGFQIPDYEAYSYDFARRSFDEDRPLVAGDFLMPFVETSMEDGALHGLYAKFSDVKDMLFAEEKAQIATLSLQTDQSVTTLGALQASVDTQLEVIGDALAVLGAESGTTKDSITALDSRVLATETATTAIQAQIAGHDASITELETRMATLTDQNQALIEFFNAFELGSIVTADQDGNVDLLGGTLKARVLETGGIVVENTDEEAPTIGTAILLPIVTDADEDGRDDETGSDGKSVVVETAAVSESSRIFVTPREVSDRPLAVTDRVGAESFTVEIKTATSEAIPFDWWIVDEENR